MKRVTLVLMMVIAVGACAQVSTTPIPNVFPQFFDNNGKPCAGCKLYSYGAGTTSPLATYKDAAGVTVNTNPVILDASGRGLIWLGPSYYKLVLKTAADVTISTVDNINGTSGGSGSFVQYNSDWNSTSGPSQILNKPSLATVATSGNYNDLSNLPSIPSGITLKHDGTANGSQSLLDLKAGANVSITDNGSGVLTIASSGGAGGGIVLSTNGSNNTSQTALNLQNGANIAITNPSAGNVAIAVTGLPTSSSWPNQGTCAANNFVTATTNGSAPTCAQPASTNLSDSASVMRTTTGVTSSQMPALTGAVTSSAGSTVTSTKTVCQIDIDGSGASGVITADDVRSWECINRFGSTVSISAVDCIRDSGASTIQIATTAGSNLLSSACSPTNGSLTSCSVSGTPVLLNAQALNVTMPTVDGTSKYIHCSILGTR